eukprot:4449765-Prymnesium_polylepis.1
MHIHAHHQAVGLRDLVGCRWHHHQHWQLRRQNQDYTQTECLTEGAHVLNVNDSYGDGWNSGARWS